MSQSRCTIYPVLVPRYYAALLVCSIAFLPLGCSSSNNNVTQESQQNGSTQSSVTLVDAGTEPRRILTVTTSGSRLLSVSAYAEETLKFEGTESVDSINADYDIKADLDLNNDGASLQLTPIPRTYSVAAVDASTTIDGRWDFTYSLFGELLEYEESDNAPLTRYNTLGIFDVPNLILPAPNVAIGSGAVWTYDSIEPEGIVTHTITVTNFTDSIITVDDKATIKAANTRATFLFNSTSTSTYDTKTLLLEAAEVTQETGFEDTVQKNEQPSLLNSVVRNRYNIMEAVQ